MAFLKPSLRWLNIGLLGVIAGALLGALFLVIGTIESERTHRERAQRTSAILIELNNVGRAALNAETGQRGYLITLDRRYLEPYRAGSDQVVPALERLRALVDDVGSPRQIELLDQIDMLTRAKFDEMNTSVAQLQRGELLEARRAILTDEGQETMERLRRSIREMERIELQELDEAATDTAQSEARVLPLLGVLGLLVIAVIISAIRLMTRAARAESEAAQAAALSEAHDRADLLARELNHRVKNLFAVILAIVQMSARDRPDAKDVTESINQRIRALLTAHEVTQGELEHSVAPLSTLVETTLAPYRSEKQPATIDGPEVLLAAKRVTPLGLVLHEMTTNAVKYGAWARGGAIDVSWKRDGDRVRLIWTETGKADAAPVAEPDRQGFGSMLTTSAARQFGGEIQRDFKPEGLVVTIDLPVES